MAIRRVTCLLLTLLLAAASGAWASPPTPLLDLDADDLAATLADGAAVANWTSTAATSTITFSQSLANEQPSFALHSINGHAAVRFQGGTKRLSTPNGSALDGLNGTAYTFTFVAFSTTSNPTQTLMAKAYTGTGNLFWFMSEQDQWSRLDNLYGGQIVHGRPYVVTFTSNTPAGGGITESLYINGQLVNQVATAYRAFNNTNPWSIGATDESLPSFPANGAYTGDIARIRVWGSGLSAADRQSEETALMAAYGIAPYSFASYANIVVLGDSIAQGTQNLVDNPSWSWVLQQNLGSRYAVANLALSGSNIGYAGDIAPNVNALLVSGATNLLLIAVGTNDLTGAQHDMGAGLTIAGAYEALCQSYRAAGWRIVAFPILPRANNVNTSFETDRLAFNAKLQTDLAGFADYFCDTQQDPALRPNANGGYADFQFVAGESYNGASFVFSQDGTHPSVFGNQAYAADVMRCVLPILLSAAPAGSVKRPGSHVLARGR